MNKIYAGLIKSARLLLSSEWEAPEQDRKMWRRKREDGSYEYRYDKPEEVKPEEEKSEEGRNEGAKANNIPPNVFKQLEVHESDIRYNDHETLIFLDDEGEVLLNRGGNEDSVSVTDIIENKTYHNRWLTHNHPRSTSFSLPDILVAVKMRAKGMRVVGAKTTYTMNFRDMKYTEDLFNRVKDMFKDIHEATYESFWKKIVRGEMTKQEATEIHNHVVMAQLCPLLGIEYIREVRKPPIPY